MGNWESAPRGTHVEEGKPKEERRHGRPSPRSPADGPVDLRDPALYVNRELSLLAFQRRVLEEAEDPSNPLLERVKFLSILGSNLDEFFMVRVAGVAAQLDAGTVEVGPDRMSSARATGLHPARSQEALNEAHQCLESCLRS